jgi:hypothetical protein
MSLKVKQNKKRYVRPVLEPRTCNDIDCKNIFVPKRRWQDFCCNACRYRAWARNKKAMKNNE